MVFSSLIGRSLPLGMWLWLLAQERLQLRAAPLYWLVIHDSAWVAVFTVFLIRRTFANPVVDTTKANAGPSSKS
jgi:hypothetical protein